MFSLWRTVLQFFMQTSSRGLLFCEPELTIHNFETETVIKMCDNCYFNSDIVSIHDSLTTKTKLIMIMLRSSYGIDNRCLLFLDRWEPCCVCVARDIFGHVIDVICMESIAIQRSFDYQMPIITFNRYRLSFCNWALRLIFYYPHNQR